jgi:RNA polymerase sigma-70 factor (ECF subfamily)
MHQDKVYNLAFRILQNAEEADDATQEAFFKVWQALGNFRGDAKFSTWLYRIVHNHCLNRLRSNKSNPRTVSVETSYDDEGEERDVLANIAGDEGDNPSLQFEGREQREVIWGQVDALPAKYRAIISMYYSDELSYEEIAEVLDIPVGTVKTHLYRAKAQLKTRLTELGNQGIIEIKRQ